MLRHDIALRREDKNVWERRVALTPEAVARLTAQGVRVGVERFERRVFPDADYEAAGATLVDDGRAADIVLGIKEIPAHWFHRGGAYLFFSHTIKGQWFNMPMLVRMMELGCTLIDYECVTDENGKRLIFFSRHAGLTGMIDTLWTLGRRVRALGHTNPFEALEPAHRYANLAAIKSAVSEVGERIRTEGVPAALRPLVVGFTGGGNVTQGALEVFDLLPHEDVAPDDVEAWIAAQGDTGDRIARVRFELEDLVERTTDGGFDKTEYYENPGAYRSRFGRSLRHLSALVHGVYWDERYPVFADAGDFRDAVAHRLLAVGDITCDVGGSLACTVRDTESGDPVFVYDPVTGEAPSGFEGPGVAVMAVGNLPTELPIDASQSFSDALEPFMVQLANTDFDAPFDEASLPDPIRRATILWHGDLTPAFSYLYEELERQGYTIHREPR